MGNQQARPDVGMCMVFFSFVTSRCFFQVWWFFPEGKKESDFVLRPKSSDSSNSKVRQRVALASRGGSGANFKNSFDSFFLSWVWGNHVFFGRHYMTSHDIDMTLCPFHSILQKAGTALPMNGSLATMFTPGPAPVGASPTVHSHNSHLYKCRGGRTLSLVEPLWHLWPLCLHRT